MAGKKCAICNKPSGMYPLCVECFVLKDKGEIIKCNKCGSWYRASKFCECSPTPPATPKKEENKVRIKLSSKVIIGKDVIDNETKDVRKKWEAGNLCDDGHYVRSYSEMLIDNWLYHNGYLHAYEKKVFMATEPDEVVLSDFYLPKGDVYIEFWGKDTEKYNMRRERKLQLYKDNNYEVISIEPDDIKILGDILQRKIFDYIKHK